MQLRTDVELRRSVPHDAATCLVIRGQTRQNAVDPERLAGLGITVERWHDDIASGNLLGYVASVSDVIIGYCFGETESGEIVVLALLPEYENRGIGRELLKITVEELKHIGHKRVFLGCSPDPASRSHGFYRYLGWVSTGLLNSHGDEILELKT